MAGADKHRAAIPKGPLDFREVFTAVVFWLSIGVFLNLNMGTSLQLHLIASNLDLIFPSFHLHVSRQEAL